MRILCFGDSITQGFNDPDGGWVQWLARPYLEKRAEKEVPDFFNLGVSADLSRDVCKRFEPEVLARKRDDMVIIVAIGVNDTCIEQGKQRATPEQYKQNLETIVSMARNFTNKILFVGLAPCDEDKTTPVSWGDYVYKNVEINKFNEVLVAECNKQNVSLVPVSDGFLGREKELMPDGLHPNTEGHKLIADLVRPELEVLVRN